VFGDPRPRPAPAPFAVAVTAFLFFKDGGEATMKFDHHIMGGTLTSTLAGEFSFTIAVARGAVLPRHVRTRSTSAARCGSPRSSPRR
jgi:hypothetical protein